MSGRPGTGRLGTASRGAGYGRVGTAQRLGTGRVGTGRLTTGRLGTGRMPTASGRAVTGVRVPDRPMTQQGLGGMQTGRKTAGSGGRIIQDESYFVGALRGKNAELTAEIANLQKQIKKLERDQESYNSYEKRAEELAAEIKQVQGELGDLNTLEDQVNQHIEPDEVREDVAALKADNDQREHDNDGIFAERTRTEAAIKQIEVDTKAEAAKEEELVNELAPDQQDAYRAKQAANIEMQTTIEGQQTQIDELEQKVAFCENELQRNPIKREAVTLHRQIAELEGKRDKLKKEVAENDVGTPEEQRERMLAKVKADNSDIATMERKMHDLTLRANEMQAELADMDSHDDSASDEKRQKYLELVKRDQEMDKFLEDFPGIRDEERARLDDSEERIVAMLQNVSGLLQRTGAMPDRATAEANRRDLSLKQKEMGQADQTRAVLEERHARLVKDKQNVKSLDTKIRTEMDDLTTRINEMEAGLDMYKDKATLEEQVERQKSRLHTDKKRYTRRRQESEQVLDMLCRQRDALEAKLAANKTYLKLGEWQKKWVAQEKRNHEMQTYINAQFVKSNWKPFTQKVTGLIKLHNEDLKTREPKPNLSRAV